MDHHGERKRWHRTVVALLDICFAFVQKETGLATAYVLTTKDQFGSWFGVLGGYPYVPGSFSRRDTPKPK